MKSLGEGMSKDGVVYAAEAVPVGPLMLNKRVNRGGRKVWKQSPTKQPYVLDFKSDMPAFLAQTLQCNNGQPWLMFVHGNNQSFSDNMLKTRQIQQTYAVNMLVFSWPSQSAKSAITDNLWQLFANLMQSGGQTSYFFSLKPLNKTIQQYRHARDQAEASVLPFIDVLSLLNLQFFSRLRANSIPVALLVHSLGHKIIRHCVQDRQEAVFSLFNKVLLHQADEAEAGHTDWADAGNVGITLNRQDSSLFFSSLVHDYQLLQKLPTRATLTSICKALARDYLADAEINQLNVRVGNRRISNPYAFARSFDFSEQTGISHNLAWDDAVDIGIHQQLSMFLFDRALPE